MLIDRLKSAILFFSPSMIIKLVKANATLTIAKRTKRSRGIAIDAITEIQAARRSGFDIRYCATESIVSHTLASTISSFRFLHIFLPVKYSANFLYINLK